MTTSTSWMTVVKSTIADDVIAMVTASEQVALDVAMALGEFNREVLVAVSLLWYFIFRMSLDQNHY